MKKIVFVSLVTTLLLNGCAGSQTDSSVPVAPVSPEPVAETYPAVELVQWSDFHSSIYEKRLDDGMALGGLPVFMAAVEHLKGSGLSLLLDGGDQFQGAMPFNDAKGLGMAEVMNALKIDVSTLGNHEFDYGPGVKYPDSNRGALKEYLEVSQFPVVTANVVATADNTDPWPPAQLKPYTLIEKGPYKIAVVGVLATETPIATTAANVAGLEFKSPAETLKTVIPEIAAQDPDFLIVNAHITGLPDPLPEDGATVVDAKFTEEVAEILALPQEILQHIDLISTAHSHKSFIAHQGDLTVIQSLSGGQELTTMTLIGDKDGLHIARDSIRKPPLIHKAIDAACGEARPVLEPMDVGGMTLTPDVRGLDIIAKYEASMKENRCDVVGCTDVAIERHYEGECALGNLVTDAMRKYYPQADIAMQNAGGVRANLAAGNIYREDLNAIMPFDNYLHLTEIPGADIVKILKIASTLKHGAIKVSGLQYKIEPGCQNPQDINGDGTTENWENNCLCEEILVNGVPLDATKKYKLAISDFLINGGDSLAGIFNNATILDKGPVIKKTILDYVQNMKASNACLMMSELKKDDNPRIAVGTCGKKFAK